MCLFPQSAVLPLLISSQPPLKEIKIKIVDDTIDCIV